MSQEHALPATHVAIARSGTEVISSFVFHDAVSTPIGLAVVMTSATIHGLMELVERLKLQSQALAEARPGTLRPPDMYVPSSQPVHAHTVSVVIAEDSDVIVLGFRCVDLERTLSDQAKEPRITIQTRLASTVALGLPSFVAWIDALTSDADEQRDEPTK